MRLAAGESRALPANRRPMDEGSECPTHRRRVSDKLRWLAGGARAGLIQAILVVAGVHICVAPAQAASLEHYRSKHPVRCIPTENSKPFLRCAEVVVSTAGRLNLPRNSFLHVPLPRLASAPPGVFIPQPRFAARHRRSRVQYPYPGPLALYQSF